MARLPRLAIAGCPQHVLQRGNNRQPIFGDAADRERYLTLLLEHATRLKVAVLAYVLLDNHVHLLLLPSDAGQRCGGEYLGSVSVGDCRRQRPLRRGSQCSRPSRC